MVHIVDLKRVDSGEDLGTFEVLFSALRLGRDEFATVSLPHADAVSFSHAEIFDFEEALFFRDVGSTNGSRLNGYFLDKGIPVPIRDQDVITLSNVPLLVTWKVTEAIKPRLIIVREGEPEQIVVLTTKGLQLVVDTAGEVVDHPPRLSKNVILSIELTDNKLQAVSHKNSYLITHCGIDFEKPEKVDDREWIYVDEFDLFIFFDLQEQGFEEELRKKLDPVNNQKYLKSARSYHGPLEIERDSPDQSSSSFDGSDSAPRRSLTPKRSSSIQKSKRSKKGRVNGKKRSKTARGKAHKRRQVKKRGLGTFKLMVFLLILFISACVGIYFTGQPVWLAVPIKRFVEELRSDGVSALSSRGKAAIEVLESVDTDTLREVVSPKEEQPRRRSSRKR